ncbi:hypothetical protein [Lentzea sp. NPDC092896]|uniref:hypothetical protein n=1 Tax=Lentzea sp. NPDC092896 TaxID=3364127 RepID=UPI00381E53D7
MRPSDVYNFVRLLEALRDHDWSAEPYVLLTGSELAGKTTIHWKLVRLLRETGLLISLDGLDVRGEDRLVQRALVGANEDELRASRITLQSTSTKTVIAGSSFNNTDVRINRGWRWWPRRSIAVDARPDEGATAMVSTLISDILAVRRDVYIVVDHFDKADPFLRHFVADTALRMDGMGTLRILLVGNKTTISPGPLAGIPPRIYEVPRLDVAAIEDWAKQLGLHVSEENARLLHTLTDKGLAGAIRTELMKLLFSEDDWRAPAGSTRTA